MRRVLALLCGVFLAGTLAPSWAAADVADEVEWFHRYTGAFVRSQDAPTHVAVDPDSGVVFVTGLSGGQVRPNFATVAILPTGQQLWSDVYLRSGDIKKGDGVYGLAVDPGRDRIYVLAVDDRREILVIAYDQDGTRLWTTVRPAGGYAGHLRVDESTGNVVVATTTRNFFAGTAYGISVFALSPSGALQWEDELDERRNDSPTGLTVDPITGTTVVTGSSVGRGGPFEGDIVAFAYDNDGTRLWFQRYGTDNRAGDYPAAVDADWGRSRVYVTGATGPRGGGSTPLTLALDTDTGAVLWERTAADEGYGGLLDPLAVNPDDGQLTVASATVDFSVPRTVTLTTYSADGQVLWVESAQEAYEAGLEVGVSYDGVTGQVLMVGTSGGRYYAVGYDPAGQLVSTHRSPGTPVSGDQATAAVPDGSGSLIVTGTSRDDYLTVSFALT